jgi:hypothetical protein
MSYLHPVLVPGAIGHDDPAYLRQVIETLSATSKNHEYLADSLDSSAARLRRAAQEIADVLNLLSTVEEDIDCVREELEKQP